MMSDTKGKPDKGPDEASSAERWRRLLADSGAPGEESPSEEDVSLVASTAPLIEVKEEVWRAATERWDGLAPDGHTDVVAAVVSASSPSPDAAWAVLDPALRAWAQQRGHDLQGSHWSALLAQLKSGWDAAWQEATQLQMQLQVALRTFLAGPELIAKDGAGPIDRPFAFFHSDPPMAMGLDEDGMWCLAAPHQRCQFHVYLPTPSWFAILQLADDATEDARVLPELIYPTDGARHQRLAAGFHHLFDYEAPESGVCRFLALFFSTPLSGLDGWPAASERTDLWGEDSFADRVRCLLQHASARSAWRLSLECEDGA